MPKLILKSLISSFLLLLFLSSCMTNRVAVETRYFSHENLASFYVNTPDPLQNDPPVGQNLEIYWSLGREFCQYENISIQYTIRFWNKEEIQESIKITKPKGYYTYSLFSDDYFRTGGILTYKVEMIGDGLIIEEIYHQLWSELIRF